MSSSSFFSTVNTIGYHVWRYLDAYGINWSDCHFKVKCSVWAWSDRQIHFTYMRDDREDWLQWISRSNKSVIHVFFRKYIVSNAWWKVVCFFLDRFACISAKRFFHYTCKYLLNVITVGIQSTISLKQVYRILLSPEDILSFIFLLVLSLGLLVIRGCTIV